MLNKEAIVETPNHLEGEFTSNLFLVEKKYGGKWPVINLKHLPALQDGRLALPSKQSKEGRLHVQTGFKRCMLFSSIKSCIQKICAVSLVRDALRVSCLCFGLGPAPRIFTNLLKVPVSVLRHLNILIIVNLDDMLLIGHTIEEKLIARDTVVFSLQQLGFVLNLQKSVLTPTQRMQFLGAAVDSLIMTLSLSENKASKVQKQCQELLQKTQVLILELTKLIGLLSSTIQAVLPAQINSGTYNSNKCKPLKHSGHIAKKWF